MLFKETWHHFTDLMNIFLQKGNILFYSAFSFLPLQAACGILVPPPGIKPMPPPLETCCFSQWTTRDVPLLFFKKNPLTALDCISISIIWYRALISLLYFIRIKQWWKEIFSRVLVDLELLFCSPHHLLKLDWQFRLHSDKCEVLYIFSFLWFWISMQWKIFAVQFYEIWQFDSCVTTTIIKVQTSSIHTSGSLHADPLWSVLPPTHILEIPFSSLKCAFAWISSKWNHATENFRVWLLSFSVKHLRFIWVNISVFSLSWSIPFTRVPQFVSSFTIGRAVSGDYE